MKKILRKAAFVAVVVTLAFPTAALAAEPAGPTIAPLAVQFVLRGSITGYAAATNSAPGSVSITVRSSNHERTLLKGRMLTFSTDAKTKVFSTTARR